MSDLKLKDVKSWTVQDFRDNVNQLDEKLAKGLGQSLLSQLDASDIQNLDVTYLSAQQISAMDANNFAGGALTYLGQLSASQAKGLTKNHITALGANVGALDEQVVKKLSAQQLQGLNSSTHIEALGNKISSLTASQLKKLTGEQIKWLTTDQIAELNVKQMRALTPTGRQH